MSDSTIVCEVLIDEKTGKKCGAVVKNHVASIAAHNLKVHGIAKKAKESPVTEQVLPPVAVVPVDVKEQARVDRARKIAAMRLEAIMKTDGPNAILDAQTDSLRRWESIARASGLVKPLERDAKGNIIGGESTYWGEIGKDAQYENEGREPVKLEGARITAGDVQLWKRDARIKDFEVKARVAQSNAMLQSYKADNEKKTKAVEQELAADD